MEIKCPDTGQVIPPEHYNVSTDLLISPFTGNQFKLSEVVAEQSQRDDDFEILSNPPSGLRERRGFNGVTASVSTRNIPVAIFMTIFTTFWNSMLSIFLVGPWLPGATSEGGGPAPKFGVNPFMTLFLIPFILCGIGTLVYAIMSWIGRYSVTVAGTRVQTFYGVGPIGYRRRFDATLIQKVTIERTGIESNEKPMKAIVLWMPEKKNIAMSLDEVKQRYFAAWLRNELGLHLK